LGGVAAEGGTGGFKPGGFGGAEGGTAGPAAAGLGGKLTMALSRGLAPVGLPSRRGGRTILTVSFLGSDMVKELNWQYQSKKPPLSIQRRKKSGPPKN